MKQDVFSKPLAKPDATDEGRGKPIDFVVLTPRRGGRFDEVASEINVEESNGLRQLETWKAL